MGAKDEVGLFVHEKENEEKKEVDLRGANFKSSVLYVFVIP